MDTKNVRMSKFDLKFEFENIWFVNHLKWQEVFGRLKFWIIFFGIFFLKILKLLFRMAGMSVWFEMISSKIYLKKSPFKN